jgi:bifunctional UDP-N-acetylglucosamine pyrophosphorylase/glucosamine-1-phosphate N-acetyltransferase
MKSRRAKVLHEIAGIPLISHVVRAAVRLSPKNLIIIVGHQADDVEKAVRSETDKLAERGEVSPNLHFALQQEQRGTGHAVASARSVLERIGGPLIVLAGDGPMIETATLGSLAESHRTAINDATLLTVELDDPRGYGRVIRNADGEFLRCVEQKDASTEELAVREVAVSIYCFEIPTLLDALTKLNTDNAQGEYYLTDVPHIMSAGGRRVGLLRHEQAEEVLGVNTRVELAELDRKLRERKLRELMLAGVTIVDPSTTYIDLDVEVGQDSIVHPQVIIEGNTRVGSDSVIHSWTRIRDSVLGNGVSIKNSCVIEECQIGNATEIGPFARLRRGAEIDEKARIGNFVEVKKSKIGRGSKASHLTYLGDATIGDQVNIGAGTITCNYDGVRKNKTIIEDNVKIGSDTMLVAPVRVGHGAVTGAGSVITKDVPPDSLVMGVPAVVKKKLK